MPKSSDIKTLTTETDSDTTVIRNRQPHVPRNLENPGVARVSQAASDNAPYGTTEGDYSKRMSHQTVRGFYELGYGVILSIVAMIVIHSNFSYPTVPSIILPDPFFRLYVKNMHRNKHGSDTGTYDNEGRFVPQNFETFFHKYSSLPDKDGLTMWDTLCGMYGQRCIVDPIGWGAEIFEWLATWILLWPRDGVIRKEDVRRIYDGSIFWKIAEQRGEKPKGLDPAHTNARG